MMLFWFRGGLVNKFLIIACKNLRHWNKTQKMGLRKKPLLMCFFCGCIAQFGIRFLSGNSQPCSIQTKCFCTLFLTVHDNGGSLKSSKTEGKVFVFLFPVDLVSKE